MITLPAINTLASNALVGTIATKLIDSVISSKISQKQDSKKWLREKKLNTFSVLSDEIVTMTCENLSEKKVAIRSIISKLVLLTNEKELINTLNNYMFILEEYECYKDEIDMKSINTQLINTIRKSINNL